jgi:hypothetical protein
LCFIVVAALLRILKIWCLHKYLILQSIKKYPTFSKAQRPGRRLDATCLVALLRKSLGDVLQLTCSDACAASRHRSFERAVK